MLYRVYRGPGFQLRSLQEIRHVTQPQPEVKESSMLNKMNMFIRTKSDSENNLTDQEILKQVKVKNISDGTEMNLCQAEDIKLENIDSMMSDLTIGEPKKRASLTKFVGNFGITFKTGAKKLTDGVRDKFNRTKEENQDNGNEEEPQFTR